jgi:hypothetical protein
MYRHILVAVDGSDASNSALREAIDLAKNQKAVLRLVHVIDETPAYIAIEAPHRVVEYQNDLREGGRKVLSICATAARGAGIENEEKMVFIKTLSQRSYDLIEDEAVHWPTSGPSSASDTWDGTTQLQQAAEWSPPVPGRKKDQKSFTPSVSIAPMSAMPPAAPRQARAERRQTPAADGSSGPRTLAFAFAFAGGGRRLLARPSGRARVIQKGKRAPHPG